LNLGIAFAPLVTEPVLWAAIAAAVILALLLFVSRSRGATIRALALALVVLALATTRVLLGLVNWPPGAEDFQ